MDGFAKWAESDPLGGYRNLSLEQYALLALLGCVILSCIWVLKSRYGGTEPDDNYEPW